MKAVVEYDRLAREKKAQNQGDGIVNDKGEEPRDAVEDREFNVEGPRPLVDEDQGEEHADGSDEYEEVEVTDEEDDEEATAKRQKIGDDDAEQPVEFNEDDIAYQLAAMGQEYGLDPGEYGDLEGQNLEEGAEGLPLSEEDASALFKDMLDDHNLNPFNPWDKIIEQGQIIDDDRYTVLSNMKTRKEVWSEWSRDRIQKLKEQKEKEEKQNPRIPYLAFLQAKATPKLYWPEFRRKYMKEPEMRDPKLSDKEREKCYRDYISRKCIKSTFLQLPPFSSIRPGLKLPESILKSDLVTMLKAVSLHALNQSTSMANLPPAMLSDIRYISLRPSIRDPLIEAHISTLPKAPEGADVSAEEQEVMARRQQDRERREALAERQIQAQREKRRAREALEYSKAMMREGEQEVQRAMRVDKGGLLSHMDNEEL